MGTLEKINDGTPEEARALAEALRTLFDSLGISLRRYAARCHTDPGALSRYFKGTRVPSWNFVVNLLAHVAEERETQTSDETVALLRQLYVRAAGASAGARRTVDLQRLLEEADEQAREAASLERLLRQALHESQQQVDQLDVELRALRAARAADRQATRSEIELFASEAQNLRAERDQLQAEVEVLKKQLAEAVNTRILAEERCDQLERQIESAEQKESEKEEAESKEAKVDQGQGAATTSFKAEAMRLMAHQDAEQIARDYEAARESLTTAQQRVIDLESTLIETRQRLSDDLSLAAVTQEVGGNQTGSLAARLGYGPEQVLRKVDEAEKLNPDDVLPILEKAFDLQSKEEVERTQLLLRSTSDRVQNMFKVIVAYSIRGSAISPRRKSGE